MNRHLFYFSTIFLCSFLVSNGAIAQVRDSLGLQKEKKLKLHNPVQQDSLDLSEKEVKKSSDGKKLFSSKKVFNGVHSFFKEDYPDPGKAALLSLFPGGGQLYNKKLAYIKIPVIYGGLTWLVILAQDNTDTYNLFKNAYLAELAGENHEFSDRNIQAATLQQYRDIYDKRRQQTYIAIGAVYALSIVEAYVTAHLLDFDVDEDLSFKIKPSFQSFGRGHNVSSIGVQIDF